jgi:hypothetical protein
MANKPKPTNAVKGAATEYARRAIANGKIQKNIKKDSTQLPVLRQLGIDTVQQDTNSARLAVRSAVQFAKTAGANKRQVAGAYYKGAVKGLVKGVKENLRNR